MNVSFGTDLKFFDTAASVQVCILSAVCAPSLNVMRPGLNLADASIFISCAMALALFDITKKVENGVVVEPVNDYTSGTIRYVFSRRLRRVEMNCPS